jgi:excinuclease ABC subunit A
VRALRRQALQATGPRGEVSGAQRRPDPRDDGAGGACVLLELAESSPAAAGQPATTLSGGEAQRIKIAAHLASTSGERILYILDEPTTGLHFDDIAKLLAAFRKLLQAGHSLLVIEHNLDVIKTADWVIDLGLEGGAEGGRVVAVGTPEQVAQSETSHTGRHLRTVLAAGRSHAYSS